MATHGSTYKAIYLRLLPRTTATQNPMSRLRVPRLEPCDSILCVPGGDPQGDLHDGRSSQAKPAAVDKAQRLKHENSDTPVRSLA